MKWNKKLDNELKNLLFLEKNYDEIAKILNLSKRCIANRTFRIGFKILKSHRETILCKNCGKAINKTLSDKKKFCNCSCSAQYNNKKRKHTEETKKKISDKIIALNKNKKKSDNIIKSVIKNGKKHTIRIRPEISIRKCRFCNENKPILKHKIICKNCATKYYKIYRPLCEFDFNIYNYKNEFDFTLIKQYGWYSPTNKNNNLNGVSKDHVFSVKDGFINNINPEIIKHPANCRLIKHSDNNKKSYTSLITLNELLEKIKYWNQKYNYDKNITKQ